MVLTVNLEPDVYDFTSAYAGAKGISIDAALTELIRRAEQTPEPPMSSSRLVLSEHGYYVVAATGHPITPEMVKEDSEDELI